jgi:hypothetical protein
MKMGRKAISGLLSIVFLVLVGFGVFYYLRLLPKTVTTPQPIESTESAKNTSEVKGEILNIVEQENVITINTSENEKVYVAPVPETKITDEQGKKVDSTYLKRGFTIQATGEFNKTSAFFPETIKVVEAPNVIVFSPLPEQVVDMRFQVTGIARVFENVLSLRIKNADTGKIYSQNNSTVRSPDIGQYGDFSFTYNLSALQQVLPSGEQLILEVYQASAKDGSDQDVISIPLIFQKNLKNDILTVQIFFSNSKLGNIASCENVYPLERQIPKVKSVASTSLEELIKGPTSAEKSKGYLTNISKTTKVNKIVIEDGVAKVDFSSDIEKNIGGSCTVQAIRAQISETLLQFPTVSSVEIMVDGKKDDVLQP